MRFIGPNGWVIDTDVEEHPEKYAHLKAANGLAPPGHRKRCQSKKSGFPPSQCILFAQEGGTKCKHHGNGKAESRRSKLELCMSNGYFRNIAGSTIRDILDEARKRSPEERLSLLEEVELMRASAGEALGLFERSLKDTASPKAKALAIQVMRDSLLDVSIVVQRATQVRSLNEQTAGTEQIEYIIAHIERILQESLTDSECAKVIKKMKEIRLPSKVSNSRALEMAEELQEIRRQINLDDEVPRHDS